MHDVSVQSIKYLFTQTKSWLSQISALCGMRDSHNRHPLLHFRGTYSCQCKFNAETPVTLAAHPLHGNKRLPEIQVSESIIDASDNLVWNIYTRHPRER